MSVVLGATGGVPAAGGGVVLTAAGVTSGIAVDLGLTVLFAPLTVPGSDLISGINEIINCP